MDEWISERDINAHRLLFSARFIGKDLLVIIHGGDESHIGGAALGFSTASSHSDSRMISVNTITAPGHKDYVVATSVAERLCRELGVNVLVSVGIHVSNAPRQVIEDIVRLVDEMVDEFLAVSGRR
ncbi:MAG: hypothetical protein QXS20_06955 [Candidatus Thorarchaeota archaeon]